MLSADKLNNIQNRIDNVMSQDLFFNLKLISEDTQIGCALKDYDPNSVCYCYEYKKEVISSLPIEQRITQFNLLGYSALYVREQNKLYIVKSHSPLREGVDFAIRNFRLCKIIEILTNSNVERYIPHRDIPEVKAWVNYLCCKWNTNNNISLDSDRIKFINGTDKDVRDSRIYYYNLVHKNTPEKIAIYLSDIDCVVFNAIRRFDGEDSYLSSLKATIKDLFDMTVTNYEIGCSLQRLGDCFGISKHKSYYKFSQKQYNINSFNRKKHIPKKEYCVLNLLKRYMYNWISIEDIYFMIDHNADYIDTQLQSLIEDETIIKASNGLYRYKEVEVEELKLHDPVTFLYENKYFFGIVIERLAEDRNIAHIKNNNDFSIFFTDLYNTNIQGQMVLNCYGDVSNINPLETTEIHKFKPSNEKTESIYKTLKEDHPRSSLENYTTGFEVEYIHELDPTEFVSVVNYNSHCKNFSQLTTELKLEDKFQIQDAKNNFMIIGIKFKNELIYLPSYAFSIIDPPLNNHLKITNSNIEEDITYSEETIEQIKNCLIEMFEKSPNVWMTLNELLINIPTDATSSLLRSVLYKYLEDDVTLGIIRRPNTQHYILDPTLRTLNPNQFKVFQMLHNYPRRDINVSFLEKKLTLTRLEIQNALMDLADKSELYISTECCDQNQSYIFDYELYEINRPNKQYLLAPKSGVASIRITKSEYEVMKMVGTCQCSKVYLQERCKDDKPIEDLIKKKLLLLTSFGCSETPYYKLISNITNISIVPSGAIVYLKQNTTIKITVSQMQNSIIRTIFNYLKGKVPISQDRLKCYNKSKSFIVTKLHLKDILKFVDSRESSCSKSDLIQELHNLSKHGIIKDCHQNTLSTEPTQPDPEENADDIISKLFQWTKSKKIKSNPRWSLSENFLDLYDGNNLDTIIIHDRHGKKEFETISVNK